MLMWNSKNWTKWMLSKFVSQQLIINVEIKIPDRCDTRQEHCELIATNRVIMSHTANITGHHSSVKEWEPISSLTLTMMGLSIKFPMNLGKRFLKIGAVQMQATYWKTM